MSLRRLTFLLAALLLSGSFSGLRALEEASWGHIKQGQQQQQVANAKNTAATYLLALNGDAAQDLRRQLAGAGKPTVTPFTHKIIGPQGGSLRLHEDNLPGSSHDFWQVELTIPPGALSQPTDISMRIHGDTLANLVVEFGPSGLVFDTPALLTLGGNPNSLHTDPAQLATVQHIAHDGSVEELPIDRLDADTDAVHMTIEIPGFSRYSLYRRSSYSR